MAGKRSTASPLCILFLHNRAPRSRWPRRNRRATPQLEGLEVERPDPRKSGTAARLSRRPPSARRVRKKNTGMHGSTAKPGRRSFRPPCERPWWTSHTDRSVTHLCIMAGNLIILYTSQHFAVYGRLLPARFVWTMNLLHGDEPHLSR